MRSPTRIQIACNLRMYRYSRPRPPSVGIAGMVSGALPTEGGGQKATRKAQMDGDRVSSIRRATARQAGGLRSKRLTGAHHRGLSTSRSDYLFVNP